MATVALALGGVYSSATVAEELKSTTIENTGDGFLLTEKSYTESESFVYTSTAYFEHGQAAALVFGAEEAETARHYWAFNIDRKENSVKLLYFYQTEEQSFKAIELLKDYYIGNDKMTQGEKNLVNPKVEAIDKVQLKVIVTAEDDGKVYADFFADNIRRFGVDNTHELNSFKKNVAGETLSETIAYEGGSIGFNCFNAKVRFEDTHYAHSDYTYYSETYRQQYHFSQYAHWNNDPNGLVYYDGWYHMYYQHHPFNNLWGDMYWGHARSRDLVSWELLPICLFPDQEGEFGPGNGYMWSGTARVYHKGESAAIDALNWYPNGEGSGLIAFYTRDGGLQDQVIMSSDDGGMTWTKRRRIPQTIVVGPEKTDCRDPKVFPVKKDGDKVTLWGMAVTGMGTGNVWFMKSENLLDWTAAGGFKTPTNDPKINFRAECPDVITLTADDNTTHTVMTFTAREYLVGEIVYDEASGQLKFMTLEGKDVSKLAIDEIPFQRMDFGPDSYATQTFFIDDSSSKYYGETVSVNWFSGVPGGVEAIDSGILSQVRKTWNGGGMTIPVKWGLVKKGNGYMLTQTPIVKDNEDFKKSEYLSVSDIDLDQNSQNILSNVNSRTLEIDATINNPQKENISFKVQVSGNEYTEIGWTKEEGYFVDRTHTYDGGLSMHNYHVRYVSGPTDSTKLSFYILADHGSVEVFCDNGAIPFYVLTFATPYSVDASLQVSGAVEVENLTVNKIYSVWRDETLTTEDTLLYVSQENVELSTSLTTTKELSVYATGGNEVVWSVESGEGVLEITPTQKGATITALKAGNAVLSVVSGNAEKTINVTVYEGTVDSDLTFAQDGIVAGDWLLTADGLVGSQSSGDGFLLSKTSGKDFTYTAKFDLGSGAAAALIFRAKADMSDYYIANYDNTGKIVKLWTPFGDLANVHVGQIDTKNVVLTVTAKGNRISVGLNGNTVAEVTDNREGAPKEGLFGLNVCATRAVFTSVGLLRDYYEYEGGTLTVSGAIQQAIVAVYNDTDGAIEINRAYYEVAGREIRIREQYFTLLSETGEYTFRVVGMETAFTFTVDVKALPKLKLEDFTLQVGCNATFYVGNETVNSVMVNGEALKKEQFVVKDGVLTIYASAFKLGENSVSVSETLKATVTVKEMSVLEDDKTGAILGCNKVSFDGNGLSVLLAGLGSSFMFIRRKKLGDNY